MNRIRVDREVYDALAKEAETLGRRMHFDAEAVLAGRAWIEVDLDEDVLDSLVECADAADEEPNDVLRRLLALPVRA